MLRGEYCLRDYCDVGHALACPSERKAPSRASRDRVTVRNEVSFLSKFAIVLSLTVCALFAQTNASRVSGPARFDLSAIDKSVDPCVDFFHYACGSWIKNNPIPPDQAMWGRFNELADRNRDILHEILEQSAKGGAGRDATTQKIGDYYGACMDEKAIDAKGLAPLEPELADRKSTRLNS